MYIWKNAGFMSLSATISSRDLPSGWLLLLVFPSISSLKMWLIPATIKEQRSWYEEQSINWPTLNFIKTSRKIAELDLLSSSYLTPIWIWRQKKMLLARFLWSRKLCAQWKMTCGKFGFWISRQFLKILEGFLKVDYIPKCSTVQLLRHCRFAFLEK